jgi:hypothetical protein
VALLGWMAATLGWAVLTGALPGPVLAWWPQLAGLAPLSAGLVLFIAGALGIVLVVYLAAALVSGRSMAQRM